jgi:hypothetical protein
MRQRGANQKSDEGHDIVVYEGFTTGLFQELELSIPYYTKVLRHLKAMGCVRQLRRGGGSAMSRWELIKEPNFLDYEAAAVQVDMKAPAVSKQSVADQMIADLNVRVEALEEWQIAIMTALRNGGVDGIMGRSS